MCDLHGFQIFRDIKYFKDTDFLKCKGKLTKIHTNSYTQIYTQKEQMQTFLLFLCTLPETNIAHEIPTFPGKYHQNCGFSMAMLVYRRVYIWFLQATHRLAGVPNRRGDRLVGALSRCFFWERGEGCLKMKIFHKRHPKTWGWLFFLRKSINFLRDQQFFGLWPHHNFLKCEMSEV